MGKGRPSEKGMHDRCIVVIDGTQCPRTDVVSYGVCGPHNTQRQRGKEFTPIRQYRTPGMSDEELSRWVVEVSPKDENGCRIWPFATNPHYGVVAVGQNEDRVRTSTHRLVARFYHNGGNNLDREQVVHHMCGVRRCVNPEHLVITTAAHNSSEAQMRINNRALSEQVEKLEEIIQGCARCSSVMTKLDENGKPLFHDGITGPKGKVKKSARFEDPKLREVIYGDDKPL